MKTNIFYMMVSLIGEQPAPNLLPVYELKPQKTLLVATCRTKIVAQRLKSIFEKHGYRSEIVIGDAYDADKTFEEISKKIPADKPVVGNFTGGTKAMVLSLIRASYSWSQNSKLCYYRSEGAQGLLYLYSKKDFSIVGNPIEVKSYITLDDYLSLYLGLNGYNFTGPSSGDGGIFEKIVADILKPNVDEIQLGLRKGALDIDLVFRCGNQVGIAELKTGTKARKKEGIDQLNTAGAREFLGTYVKKFLIVDSSWEQLTNLKELAKAHNIKVIELISYNRETQTISEDDKAKLINVIRTGLFCGA